MRHVRPGSTVAAAFLAALVGCSSARTLEETANVSECARCHGFPPTTIHDDPNATHPAVAADAAACNPCHSTTVDPSGNIIAGGGHENGIVDVTVAHEMPFVAQHPPAALAGVQSCKGCHGDDYAGGTSDVSCNECHQTELGLADWQTNCTFCHGTRTSGVATATRQAAPPQSVVVTADQTRANPKVGAHQAHLTQSSLSNALPCASCHAVPAGAQALTHFTGNGAPGAISFNAVATKGAAGAAYTGGSCSVYCHGSGTEFPDAVDPTLPAWTATVACGDCHRLPPVSGPTISGQAAHVFHVTGQSLACGTCHPALPAQHVNGTKDVVVAGGGGPVTIAGWDCNGCHGALGVALMHPLPFVNDHASVALAALDSCQACHGTDFAGGTGPSCNACHENIAASAPDWKANCSFCHGARTAGVTTATAQAAPPQAVVSGGDQSSANPKVGAHQEHLAAGGLAPALPCASCHVVPAGAEALTHFTGNGAPGAIAFSAVATKGAAGAAYAGGTCNVYCHGSGTEFPDAVEPTLPAWTATVACGDCHGLPPVSGPAVVGLPAHLFHVTGQSLACGTCHPALPAQHVNGTKDVVVAGGGGPVTITGWDCASCHDALGVSHPAGYVGQHTPDALADIASCTSCHGATYDGGFGPSCNACHASSVAASAPDWKTNCTFCHGTRTAGVSSATAQAAPPEAVVSGGDQSPANPKVGAHQAHLNAGTFAAALPCTTCHTPPDSAAALTHFSGNGSPALITFSALAQQGVTGASFDGTSCSVYCHGSGTGWPAGSVAANRTPAWTSTALACDACHASRPATGRHTNIGDHAAAPCAFCHQGYVQDTSVDPAIHVNGQRTLVFPRRNGGGAITTLVNPGWANCDACHGANGNANAPQF